MKEVRKMDKKVELYHGSGQIVEFPEVRKTRYTKDFSWGFYLGKQKSPLRIAYNNLL